MDSGNAATTIEFNHFDVVPLASDHYYSHSNTSNKAKKTLTDQSNGSVYAHIMKEWKILKKNLPESIYVQAYETRIDLLRAVIVGSPGTPYHDGLFFFDILLPYDYPNYPPKVYYHSHGYRLNPNLYANGRLCLSLINTWLGRKSEKWTKGSTLLQVLVSIQGLVLNERPYFNEPAFEKYRDSKEGRWAEASMHYNEEVFILSCKTMSLIVRNPPENFESFVYQHFRSREASILQAIEDYKHGRLHFGQSRTNGDGICSSSSLSSSVKVTPKFQGKLVLVYNELKKAFAEMSDKSLEPRKVKKVAPNRGQAKEGCFIKLFDCLLSYF